MKLENIFTQEEIDELDDQFDPCQHGRKLRCDACASRDWQTGRDDGFESGVTFVINQLKDIAGKAFVANNDSLAKSLRDAICMIERSVPKTTTRNR